MAYEDNVRTSLIAYFGIVCALGILVVVLLLQVLFYDSYNQLQQQELASAEPPTELAQLTAQQQTMLTQRKWVDRNTGKVTIGISTAMERVVTELAEGKSAQSVVGPSETPPEAPEQTAAAETPETTRQTPGDRAPQQQPDDAATENPPAEDAPADNAAREDTASEDDTAGQPTTDDTADSQALEESSADQTREAPAANPDDQGDSQSAPEEPEEGDPSDDST